MAEEHRVVVVTGAAHGIGLACATWFARDGAAVILADIDEEEGEKAAAVLAEAGHEARFIHCDVGERLDIRNLIATTLETYGGIQTLINNAGIAIGAPFLELSEDDFDKVLRVNLKGTFLMSQGVAKHMVDHVENGGAPGSIVNMSSINAVLAISDQVAYTVSKGGVGQLTKAMSLALAPHGIRVNAIGPGSINTNMLASIATDEQARRKVLARTPLGRIGEPAEVASVAAFLASDEASYITGQTIYPEGGRLGLNYTVPVTD